MNFNITLHPLLSLSSFWPPFSERSFDHGQSDVMLHVNTLTILEHILLKV